MSDDEADPELLELLRQSLGMGTTGPPAPPETRVLESAEFIADNAIDVALVSQGTKAAAQHIWARMQEKQYSTSTWATHELHPKTKDEATVNFIFTMDLLNFCFWSERGEDERSAVEYKGKKWTGYWSLVAALQRALEEDIPITSPDFWQDENEATVEVLRHVFRSATDEEIPLFDERVACLREAGRVLYEDFDCRVTHLIAESDHSAARLVNLLVEHFSCFRDESVFEGRTVRFYKRAQIFVADLWACFEGEGYGEFEDIDKITMFAGEFQAHFPSPLNRTGEPKKHPKVQRDPPKEFETSSANTTGGKTTDYRIPQILHQLGCLRYSPPLESAIRRRQPIPHDHSWEIQIRGCTIHAVTLLLRCIRQAHPDGRLNAVLLDFFLYDTMKERERAVLEAGAEAEAGAGAGAGGKVDVDVDVDGGMPHHRTRSIWY
ncbi:MAG: hypothetical protein M1819_001477 [Sarea resinae]|nr:MAG: hypothetical protein M1819_001477 [Sarea resinae]